MAILISKYKGESLTIGFTLPETYDPTKIELIKVYIGSTIYPHTIDTRQVRVELTSLQTAAMTGRLDVVFLIDDEVFGIKKVNCGCLEIKTTQATFKDESINTGYDVLVMLKVEVDTIAVDAVLYDVLKGDKGDKGDNAFTVWQSQIGNEDKTEQDYFDFLQEPANEAIQQVLETEGEIIAAEGLRVIAEQGRFNAEGLRYDAEVLRIAQYGLSQQATQDANDAANLANEKAGLANQAAIDANNAVENLDSTLFEKVDKETGKSLIADTEIEKLSKVDLVTEKITPIDADSVGLWDSVVNKFVRTKLSDFKTFLGLTFEKLSNKKSVINPTSTTEYPNSKGIADVIIPAEQVTAESLTVLNRRIEALETILANSQYSKIDVLDEFNFFGKTNLILLGVTSPIITPDFIGQFYINTTAGITYQSKGVTNSGDWKQTSN